MVERELEYDRGTLILRCLEEESPPAGGVRSEKSGLSCAGVCVSLLLTWLHRDGVPYADKARRYEPLRRTLRSRRSLPHQKEAVSEWIERGRRGVVVLPTGAGKTFTAELCIASRTFNTGGGSTLDLMAQWVERLSLALWRTHWTGGWWGAHSGSHHGDDL